LVCNLKDSFVVTPNNNPATSLLYFPYFTHHRGFDEKDGEREFQCNSNQILIKKGIWFGYLKKMAYLISQSKAAKNHFIYN
jgi:hypothetical protein